MIREGEGWGCLMEDCEASASDGLSRLYEPVHLCVSSRWRSPSGQRQRPASHTTGTLRKSRSALEFLEDGRTLEELRQAGQTL